MTDVADPWADYDSGPFCRHWDDPATCERRCARCGHGCVAHDVGDSTSCSKAIEQCECPAWVEPEGEQ